MTQKVALIGFGGVAQGFIQILRERGEELPEHIQVVSITDWRRGAVHDPNGLDLDFIAEIIETDGTFEHYPERSGVIKGWNSFETIQQTNADTIVEVTFTDVLTGQPAIDHCKEALRLGKHVVTTNKGPIAVAYQELKELADANGVQLLYEGTVMSGTPALRLPEHTLIGNNIQEVKGILNGTTNYILTEMERGKTFEQALQDAQTLGYAEADPTSDVEGYDVLYKVVILANVMMGIPLKPSDVERVGISHLTPRDIKDAHAAGERWKLIGRVKKEGERTIATVRPERLPLTDPLANINGAINAITYECDISGPITLIGAGAGVKETGFALLIDLLHVNRLGE
ncbi:homoserine dehydrogenase [Halalkalibacterium halodurans]|uniref:homoserine dehydrogenase n=1 Tax=Halalkalibacterium halodurans TaxID=86665 RepID=UPI0010FF4C41|nr:homoserine dehydrogenase [Halalkalibacterium halodurans]